MSWWIAVLVAVVQALGNTADCIALSSAGRLARGESFSVPVGRGLEFRLLADGAGGLWRIVIGPTGDKSQDFLWVVSPPFRTAPQLMIGNSYGYSAKQSVQIPRDLRFVLIEGDYREALQIVQTQLASPEKLAALERLGKGSLTLKVIAYGLSEGITTTDGEADGLDWIEFEGLACVPH